MIMFFLSALQYYRCRNDVGDEIKGMIDDDRNREKSYTIRQFLADKTLIKPLLVACIIPAAGQLNGIGAVRISQIKLTTTFMHKYRG